jgi:hypothetical protein
VKLAAAALALAVLAVGGSTGFTPAKTPRTIVDANHDNLLEYGPRDGYTRRTIGELGAPGDRVPLIRFAQMTDTQPTRSPLHASSSSTGSGRSAPVGCQNSVRVPEKCGFAGGTRFLTGDLGHLDRGRCQLRLRH